MQSTERVASSPSAARPSADARPDSKDDDASVALLKELERQCHISVCFANAGTTEMNLLAALDQVPSIRPVLCLHEIVATGAADAFARMTGRPALSLLHLGLGLSNGLANLHNCRRGRAPQLVLVGEHASWLQEADPILHSDIAALAGTVSASTITFEALPPRDGPEEFGAADAGRIVGEATHKAPPSGGNGSEGAPPPWVTFGLAEQGTGLGGIGGSRVATMVLPHDASWGPARCLPAADAATRAAIAMGVHSWSRLSAAGGDEEAIKSPGPGSPGTPPSSAAIGTSPLPGDTAPAPPPSPVRYFARALGEAIKKEIEAGGKVGIYLGGAALASEEALRWAGRIAAAHPGSITLLCMNAFPRVERGAGMPNIKRLQYFPEHAQAELRHYSLLVTVDVKLPVANFGYKGGISHLVTHLDDSHIWEIDTIPLPVPPVEESGILVAQGGGLGRLRGELLGGESGEEAELASCEEVLRLLTHELLGADRAEREEVVAGVNCRGALCAPGRPPLPPFARALDPQVLCATLAALQPEGAILVDESLTSGGPYWDLSKGCPRFTHLTLTGGAIGSGPPMAVGAAVACPGRLVIDLQADGSAMYSLQALWSQAREGLDVVTIICDNSAYSILKIECARQRLPPAGHATRSLTDLSSPRLDWVSLALGMGVRAVKVSTCGELREALSTAIDRWREAKEKGGGGAPAGPCLIQACLS